MPDILETITKHKWAEIVRLRARCTQGQLEQSAAKAPLPRDFWARIQGISGRPDSSLNIIAEIKKASPSKGVIRQYVNPASVARAYEKAGAVALSVLTDKKFFRGKPESLTRARQATGLPALRKDFILVPEQVWESRALGADAVLLIVAAVDSARLRDLIALVHKLGMTALVEVHTEDELAVALDAGARCIGVNNRDLSTFAVDIGVTERLTPLVPSGIPVISESGLAARGLADRATLLRLRDRGVSAFLIGEAFMAAVDPGAALRALVEGEGA